MKLQRHLQYIFKTTLVTKATKTLAIWCIL